MEDVRSQPPSKIVILKPGPVHFPSTQLNVDPSPHCADTMKNMVQNERNSSYFSLAEIKRRLNMGKDRQGISPEGIVRRVPPEYKKRSESEKGITGENANLNVPCEHYHDILLEANVPSPGGVALEGTIDTEESSQTRCQEGDRVSNAPLEISSSSITINMDSAHVTEAYCIEESSSQSLELAPEYLKTLVRKHLARYGEWMDLQNDIGNIGIGIEAAILEDLLEETIFILADDTIEKCG